MAEEADDIEADIRAALGGDAGAQASGAAASPPAPQSAAAPETQNAGSRDASGRFAPAPQEPAQPTGQPGTAATGAEEPTRPPAAWSAAAKAKFATLDPEVQAEVVKREKDVDRGLQERAGQLKRYEPLETVIAPVRDRLAMAGVSEAQYFGALAAADAALRDPNRRQAAFAQLAQQYGIQLPQGSQQGQQPVPQAQMHPAIAALSQQVQALTQHHQQAQQQAEAAAQAKVTTSIEAFKSDPANLYFENVKGRMAALLQTGQAADLKDAYEQACWADPSVRPLMGQTAQASAAASSSAKVQQARAAAGSVVGAPGAGGSPAARASNPNSSVEDDVRDAFASLRA